MQYVNSLKKSYKSDYFKAVYLAMFINDFS